MSNSRSGKTVHPALRGGTPMPTGPDDAVATAQLIDRCYRAAGLPPRNRKTLTPTDRRS